MSRDPRFDPLFEPIRIGPKVARNRFFQVPHCTGMGRWWPTASAVMRGVKAEGGWAVVSTEQCDIHPTGNVMRQIRLWDEQDIPALARTAELIQAHGSLAAIELVHNGYKMANLESREIPMAPSARPVYGILPVAARAMDRSDIKAVRRWHRQAALNARKAGFDIVYVYAGHDLALPMHFLARRHNQRTDEYGGSLANRARLLRELLEDTHDAVGDRCAVALRLAVDELLGPDGITSEGEGREIVAMVAEMPDLWDVNVSAGENDSLTARFGDEGFQEPYTSFVKSLTSKPVVGVGRYTSPDRMLALVKKGVLDFIGAARPSIADPFLPRKIEEGRIEDIRECIGCNICVAGNNLSSPMRCTQNPTMSEEWRRDWHPERVPPRGRDEKVLVVGAGPAGLEAARTLGQRGYRVMLAEAGRDLGGRVARECRLPGLAAWRRVTDWRLGQLAKLANVELFRESRMTAEDVLQAECDVAAIATGARWRADGVGRRHSFAIDGLGLMPVLTPDDIMDGALPPGPVLVYDDDHYYMGGVVAEALRRAGLAITLVTPESMASAFTQFTLEQARIQGRLIELGVAVLTATDLVALHKGEAEIACVYTSRTRRIEAGSVVMVTTQTPEDSLYMALMEKPDALAAAGIRRVARIGDALAPGLIAAAVWSGHRFGREIDRQESDAVGFRRENVELAAL
ncbi:MAG: FAD-dependent oxidoreductase [Alphaproteobacteria bacterium]|nr:FAD-dependent oxidoreductase [Alphaproteobacteria bacterium]